MSAAARTLSAVGFCAVDRDEAEVTFSPFLRAGRHT